jgi:hypothetical protein
MLHVCMMTDAARSHCVSDRSVILIIGVLHVVPAAVSDEVELCRIIVIRQDMTYLNHTCIQVNTLSLATYVHACLQAWFSLLVSCSLLLLVK